MNYYHSLDIEFTLKGRFFSVALKLFDVLMEKIKFKINFSDLEFKDDV